MAVIMLPGSEIEEQLQLSELVTLEEAGFEDGSRPVRELDLEYVEQLAETPAQELPPVKVVRVSIQGVVRCAMIDGYHRWEAAKMRDDQSIKGAAYTYKTEYAVIIDAFEANTKHGLKTSKQTRTEYALWLHDKVRDSDDWSLRDIAKVVGLNVSTVSRAVRKHEQESESEPDKRERAEVEASKKLVNALHKFYQEERTILGMFSKGDGKRDVKHRAKAIYNHIASLPEERHSQLIDEMMSLHETLDAFLEMVEAS